ncbi:hypothetical protein JB92DRAFT_2916102 [Gautieria morchelliformis]|nr:hypothetical protein JB92DRAFT_2916102 [Gautieria morchelliformis]
MDPSDAVSLHALALAVDIGPDHWDRQRAQPVLLTLHAHSDLAPAGRSDDVADSIHYGHLARRVLALQHTPFPSIVHLAEAAAAVALAFPPVHRVRVIAHAPKLLPQAHSLSVELESSPDRVPGLSLHINELALHVLIGVNPPERIHKQLVVTTVSFLGLQPSDPPFPHRTVVARLAQHIESSAYLTLEAFATELARVACFLDGMDLVTIKAHKPSAVSFAHSSGVQLTRDRAFFQPSPS